MTNNDSPTADFIIAEAKKMLPIWKRIDEYNAMFKLYSSIEDIMPAFSNIALCIENLLVIIDAQQQSCKLDHEAAVLQSKEILELKEEIQKKHAIISTLTI